MLMRVAEEFGVHGRHVPAHPRGLQGGRRDGDARRAAPRRSATGGPTSSRSYDAIPYNGSLMCDRGVVVSFNSDSDELARRLNIEAAKAVQVRRRAAGRGAQVRDAQPGEAARDRQARRLARGRQGRRLRRSGAATRCRPTRSRCETWIEGRKYFDRAADLARRAGAREGARRPHGDGEARRSSPRRRRADRSARPRPAPAADEERNRADADPSPGGPTPTAPAPQKGSGR